MKPGSISNFQKQVYRIVKKIPKGRVATYSQIAKKIQNAKNWRGQVPKERKSQDSNVLAWAVGNALHHNSDPTVPCHRVIKSCGSVGGYAGGLEKKVRLLIGEGVKIRDGKTDLKIYGWPK